MSSLFKPKKEVIVNDQSAQNLNLQKAALANLTDNPAFTYHRGVLDKINAGNYGSLSTVQAANNEAAKATRANNMAYSKGAAAFSANPHIQDAARNKQNADILENIALGIPGLIAGEAGQSTGVIQNAYGNQAAGYGDAAKTALETYKTYYKPSVFSRILGAAAPFASLIPGVGPIIGAGMSAVSGATGGGGGQSGSAAGLGGWGYSPNSATPSFGSQSFSQAKQQLEKSAGEATADTVTKTLNGASPSGSQFNYAAPTDNPTKRFRSSILGGSFFNDNA